MHPLLTTVIRGDPWRKSRFHDMQGAFVGWSALITDLPRVIVGASLRETIGYRPAVPWLPYPAISRLERLIQPHFRVLEFGAGMSTLWLAQRVQFVHSIETDEEWYGRVRARMPRNVRLDLRTAENYTDLSDYPDGFFDLVLVDGARRDEAVEASRRVAGSFLYFDNPDFGAQWSLYADAERMAAELGDVEYFVGFPPNTFITNRGMLVAVRKPTGAT